MHWLLVIKCVCHFKKVILKLKQFIILPIFPRSSHPTLLCIFPENNRRKINRPKEIEILKAASPKYLLNDVIEGQNDSIFKLLPTSVI